MLRSRTLPSFSVLITVVSLAFLLPLLAFGVVRWQEANAEYRAALSVQESAKRLQLLLQLAPALSQEELSTVWTGSGSGIFDGLETGGGEQLIPDFGASMEADRGRVDELIKMIGDEEILEAVVVLRSDSAAGAIDFFDYAKRYGEIVDLVETDIGIELRHLNSAVAEAGTGEVIEAARIGEAAAALQMVAAGQETRWAQLYAAEIFPPFLGDAVAFAESVAVYQERVEILERVAPPSSRVGARWLEVRASRSTMELRQMYGEIVRRFAVTGVDPTILQGDSLEANQIDLLATLRIASEITAGLRHAEAFAEGLETVVQASLEDIDSAAQRAVVSADDARWSIGIWSMIFLAVAAGCALAMVITVGRPIRRMAYTAQRLSRGQLDVRLRESGPTEVRQGARALNEALASVSIAEAQAVALAEERLDDEILKKSAPGELGKSLHVAVNRLAESISEREGFQRQLEHEASHDHLTKLPNRAAVLRHLSSAMARTSRNGTTMALLFLDIDDFKAINDTHGHHTGDDVLLTVAQRLVSAIREGDLAGRLGGDEFVVVAEPVVDIDAAIALSGRILAVVNQPITVEGVTFYPSVSIGVGVCDADSNLTADELLRDADSAVYRAKGRGKARVEVCDDDLRLKIRERDTLEDDIARAIEEDELVLYFQPTVCARSHAINGVEALVRWNRPDVGMVFPDQFIPAAERTDLILDIDRWVLDATICQAGHWANNELLRSLDVSVNISARHLGTGTLCDEVRAATTRYGVEASQLIVEVTETAVLEDVSMAARELAALRELGLRIALDDFGTGFMSLTHLRQLPVDILKIDRSFISEIESEEEQSLVSLIVDTGHVLGMAVTGEGVERLNQAKLLRRMEVDSLQGYFFSRPVPVIDVARLAAAFHPSAAVNSR